VIIDCHCHAGAGDGLTGPWDTAALFPAFHTDYAVANREVAQIVASGRGRFIGFAFVHADRDARHVRALVGEAVQRYGFRGIKVHRHDAAISREVCDVARAFRIPVLYDVMGEVAQVELLAKEYPDVSFIIPHLGSFADDWRAQLAFIDHLARHDNVYTDTSGVRRFDLLLDAVRRGGAHKVLFGSDGPWLHPGVELAKVRALQLPPDAERRVVGQNMIDLLRRRDPPRTPNESAPSSPRRVTRGRLREGHTHGASHARASSSASNSTDPWDPEAWRWARRS
jgi:predicted TIM-barrel fold metal-dependent hydrolase